MVWPQSHAGILRNANYPRRISSPSHQPEASTSRSSLSTSISSSTTPHTTAPARPPPNRTWSSTTWKSDTPPNQWDPANPPAQTTPDIDSMAQCIMTATLRNQFKALDPCHNSNIYRVMEAYQQYSRKNEELANRNRDLEAEVQRYRQQNSQLQLECEKKESLRREQAAFNEELLEPRGQLGYGELPYSGDDVSSEEPSGGSNSSLEGTGGTAQEPRPVTTEKSTSHLPMERKSHAPPGSEGPSEKLLNACETALASNELKVASCSLLGVHATQHLSPATIAARRASQQRDSPAAISSAGRTANATGLASEARLAEDASLRHQRGYDFLLTASCETVNAIAPLAELLSTRLGVSLTTAFDHIHESLPDAWLASKNGSSRIVSGGPVQGTTPNTAQKSQLAQATANEPHQTPPSDSKDTIPTPSTLMVENNRRRHQKSSSGASTVRRRSPAPPQTHFRSASGTHPSFHNAARDRSSLQPPETKAKDPR